MRRHLLVVTLCTALLGVAALVGATGVSSTSARLADAAEQAPLEASIARPVATLSSTPLDTINDRLDRGERVDEAARTEARQPTRSNRPADWALGAVVITLALAPLAVSIASRRMRNAAGRIGHVTAARAPPLSLACT